MVEPLSAQVVARVPVAAGGLSFNPLERVTLRDGWELLCKRVSPEWDWLTRATGDDGRALAMWEAGLFDRIPVDHATVAVERTDAGWDVYMRDASKYLVGDDERLDAARLRTLMRGVADLHRTFAGEDLPPLCGLEDRYGLVGPGTQQREQGTVVGDVIAATWEAFADAVPPDVAEPVLALNADPTPLCDALRRHEQTLVHGDVRLSNMGFAGDRLVLIDWGERTGTAPAAVEVASFLVFDAPRLDVPPDAVLEEFRAASGDVYDAEATDLALIGGLVQCGANPFLDAVLTGSEESRKAAAEQLGWWVTRVRRAFETWSP